MKQYRHIEHLLKVYYHQLDGLQQRTEHDLQHTRARLQELEALLASDELLPSVGIGHYGLLEGLQQGRHDDATFRGVVLLEREIQCHAEERARLRSWEVKLCGELREYARFRDMVTDVLHALAQTDKETFSFIDAHYREKHSCVDIALATYCDLRNNPISFKSRPFIITGYWYF